MVPEFCVSSILGNDMSVQHDSVIDLDLYYNFANLYETNTSAFVHCCLFDLSGLDSFLGLLVNLLELTASLFDHLLHHR